MSEPKDFHSSNNKTARLLPFLGFYAKSINILNVPSYMTETKDFHSSNSDKNCFADFITGKVETLGSTFSNETPTGGCLRPHTTIDKSITILNVPSYMTKPKDFHSSKSDKICFCSFYHRKS